MPMIDIYAATEVSAGSEEGYCTLTGVLEPIG